MTECRRRSTRSAELLPGSILRLPGLTEIKARGGQRHNERGMCHSAAHNPARALLSFAAILLLLLAGWAGTGAAMPGHLAAALAGPLQQTVICAEGHARTVWLDADGNEHPAQAGAVDASRGDGGRGAGARRDPPAAGPDARPPVFLLCLDPCGPVARGRQPLV